MKKDDYTPVVKLIIPSNTLFLKTALDFIENVAEVFEFSEQEIFQIRVASEEAISNIIKHAFSNDIKESFTIVCKLKSTQFEIILLEKGKPFEIEKITKYDPKNISMQGDIKGLGNFLMQKYMDIVEYKNMGRDGKETILIKYPKSQRFDTILKNFDTKRKKVENFKYRIKKFEDDDAIGISECAYSAYGYTYSSYIYYPSKIIALNQAEVMKSVVVQNIDTKEVIAHAALKYDNNPFVAEIGVAFVKKEYRGNNIFKDLNDYMVTSYDIIDTRGTLKCLFAKTVTSHTISQNMLLEKGAVPIAITLAIFPSNVDFKDLVGEVPQKGAALFLSINTNTDHTKRVIYPPSKHKKTVDGIFKDLKYNFISKSPKDYSGTKEKDTKIDYKIMDIFNCAEIYCTNYQENSSKKIHSVLKTLCLNRVDAIYLYLDLEDSSVGYLAKECEELGFFFAGILPFGIEGRHAIIFQYLNNLSFDFRALKVAGSKARMLKEYVKKCYNNAMVY